MTTTFQPYRKLFFYFRESPIFLEANKKHFSEKAISNWKTQSKTNTLISKTLGALAVDPGQKSKEEKGHSKAEAKMAQELAMEIAMGMDGKKEKPKA